MLVMPWQAAVATSFASFAGEMDALLAGGSVPAHVVHWLQDLADATRMTTLRAQEVGAAAAHTHTHTHTHTHARQTTHLTHHTTPTTNLIVHVPFHRDVDPSWVHSPLPLG